MAAFPSRLLSPLPYFLGLPPRQRTRILALVSAFQGTQPETYIFYELDTQLFGDERGHSCPHWELTIRWKAGHHSNRHAKTELQMVMKAGPVKKRKTLLNLPKAALFSGQNPESHCSLKALHHLPPLYPAELISPYCASATAASWLTLSCAGLFLPQDLCTYCSRSLACFPRPSHGVLLLLDANLDSYITFSGRSPPLSNSDSLITLFIYFIAHISLKLSVY